MNHHGCQPSSRLRKAPNRNTAPTKPLQTNNRFAAIRWSASAPPITGETSAQSGGTMNAAATHSESPITRKIFVSEDIQKPDVIPWKKNASHKTENTLPADPGRAT